MTKQSVTSYVIGFFFTGSNSQDWQTKKSAIELAFSWINQQLHFYGQLLELQTLTALWPLFEADN